MTDSQTDDRYVPISSQKAQTGGADLVTEYVEFQSCFFLSSLGPLYWARLCLIDDPPFLHLIVFSYLPQGQGDVQFLFTYKNENKFCH